MNEIIIKKASGKKRIILFFILVAVLIITALFLIYKVRDLTREHSASDFGFEDIKSPNDADGDGTEDYMDFVTGAREYVATKPEYLSKYYAGGYPDEGEGVCTDVIWKAFAAAGYSLKDLVDADISANKSEYPESSDSNIDFRRVRNLSVFFKRNAESLPISLTDPEDWMPGDIVIYDGHIALCSEKRNAYGFPYIIHHTSGLSGAHEGNELSYGEILGHFRYCP